MNTAGRWQIADTYWVAVIVALCVLIVVGFVMYCGMGARLDEPRKKGAQAVSVVAVSRAQPLARSWASRRV